MGTTSAHALPYPDPADPLTEIRTDIRDLAEAADAKIPKILYGTGDPPLSGMREGDVYLKYV